MRQLFLCGFFLSSYFLAAQAGRLRVTTDYSAELPSTNFEAVLDSIGTYNGYTYFATISGSDKRGTSKVQVRGLNAAMAQHGVADIPLTYKGQIMNFVKFTLHEGTGHLFTAFLNGRSGTEYLLHQTVSLTDGSQGQEPEILLSVEGASEKNRADWSVLPPTTAGKHAISYYTPGRRKVAQSFHVAVLDATGKTDFAYLATNSNPDTRQNYILWDIDPQDNLYLTFSEQDDDSRRADVLERKRAVVRVSGRGTQVHQQAIRADDHLVGSPEFNRTNGRITVAGTYANQRNGDNLGVYLNSFDADELAPGFQTTLPIAEGDNSLPAAAASEDEAGKGLGKYLKWFRTIHLSATADGGGYLVGEGYFREAEKAPGGRSVQWVDTYLDLVIVRFGASGTVEWVRSIPRHTAIVDELHVPIGGTFVHTTEDRLFIGFNDDEGAVGQLAGRAKKKFSHMNQMLLRCLVIGPENAVREGTSNAWRQTKHILPVTYGGVDPQTGDVVYIVTKRLKQKFARLSVTP